MLPEDSKSRRALSNEMLRQTSVHDHFKPTTAEDKPIPYSDETFKQAAIEWLIETNQVSTIVYAGWSLLMYLQPIQAFEHPKFQKMVNIAARATRAVKFPSRKQTRQAIIHQFKEQMKALKERLNVIQKNIWFSIYG